MSRVPIRLRLTAAFAVAMGLVLAVLGVVVYERFENSLDDNVDRSLRSRAADIAAVIESSGPRLPSGERDRFVESEESFAQVLDSEGRVVDGSALADSRPLIGSREIADAAGGSVTVERDDAVEEGDPARLFVVPVGDHTLVVGQAIDDNEESLETLRALLLLGLPVALLLASLAGYAVAAAALRPVDDMRRKAASISEENTADRLPVPESRDEISRLGETLNAMLARMEAALERERGFVADASHELRTPLAVLKTELELALREGRTTEELREALRSASEETDRLTRLADDLLVLARSDRGTLELKLEPVRVQELLERVGRRFGPLAGEVEVEAPGELTVRGDPLRLEQALGNLVANAAEHGHGLIRISARRADGAVELHVEDSGPGLSPEFTDRAFERFTRADSSRTGGGAGLGLAIVDAIARAHGGRAGAAGADVWIALPALMDGSSVARTTST